MTSEPSSRITNGGIELLVDAGSVERIGFGTIYEMIKEGSKRKKMKRHFEIIFEDGRYYEEEERLEESDRHVFPSTQTLHEILQKGIYLAHARLNLTGARLVKTGGELAYYCGTADVYLTSKNRSDKSPLVMEVPDRLPVEIFPMELKS